MRALPDKLVEMVGAQDGPIPGEVIEVVHDDGDEQVEDEEGADDKKGDEVGVGKVRAAASRVACVLTPHVAKHVRVFLARQHDLLPGLAGGGSEQDEERLREGLEVVVPVNVATLLRCDFAKHLKK